MSGADWYTPRYSVCRPAIGTIPPEAFYDTNDAAVAIHLRDRERDARRDAEVWDWSVPAIIEHTP